MSTEKCCRTRRGSNQRPPDHQLDVHLIELLTGGGGGGGRGGGGGGGGGGVHVIVDKYIEYPSYLVLQRTAILNISFNPC